MRSGRYGSLSCTALLFLIAWAGCSSPERTGTPPSDTWVDVCVDNDGDGHGFQCEQGDDCDDTDSTLFEGCEASCSKPAEGCDCPDEAAPIDCTLSKELTSSGGLLCKNGTRYCRDGKWSACEGIKSFEAPPPSRYLSQALIQNDAAPVICSECHPDCYRADDPLSETDANYGNNVVSGSNGGITLTSYTIGADGGAFEGGGMSVDGGLLDDTVCTPGTAPDFDCDGIPDDFDELPGEPPFSSDHKTIFMDLGPGDAKSESFEIRFYLNTADIYLYLDMTGSMDDERANLINSLRSGNFMPGGGAGVTCADRNFNGRTDDEEYLKNGGIAGNLACMIRDSRLGTGWHRDLPFPTADSRGFGIGPHDFELFQHEQDITNDVDAVLQSLNRFSTRGNINRPEGGIMGLWALATGGEMYMGWNRPGNPRRGNCGPGTWGYACFRDDAVPIVIWMTDAPASNGPSPTQGHLGSTRQGNQWNQYANQLVNWEPAQIAIQTGSDGQYHEVSGNEAFNSAFDVGDVSKSFRTFVGDTRLMGYDITYDSFGGCGANGSTSGAWRSSQQNAPDAVFKLRVTEEEPVTISTRGSRFNTTLAVIDAKRIDGVNISAAASGNTSPGAAHELGSLTSPAFARVTGSTTNTGAAFTRDSLGCLADGTGSSDKIGATVLKFNLAQDVTSLNITSDGNYAMATSLFAGQPMTPTDVNMSTQTRTVGGVTLTGNSNDYFEQYALGAIDGQYRRFINGTTNDSDLRADFPASYFQSGTCGGTSGTAKDAVFDFTLNAPRRIRIEGAGNNATLQAGMDHVLQLVRRGAPVDPVVLNVSGNTSDATAQFINLSQMPSDPNGSLQFAGTLAANGSTPGLRAEYFADRDLEELVLSRSEANINFDYGTGSPDPSIASDNFSARWTGFVTPQYTQAYTFYTYSDDGVRLWINDELIIDNWTDHAPTENTGTTPVLTAGQPYSIRMEYFEGGGGAVAQLSWSSASQSKQIIPAARFSSGGSQFSYLQSEVGPLAAPSSSHCNNNSAAPNSTTQAVFALDVTSTQTYEFDTLGSGVATWLSFHSDVADTQFSVSPSNPNNSGAVQALGLMDERSVLVSNASLSSHVNTAAHYVSTSVMGCGGTSSNGGRDAIYSFSVTSPQTIRAAVISKTGTVISTGNPDFNARLAVFRGSISAGTRVGGGCTDPSGNAFDSGDISVVPGETYFVVVKQVSYSTSSSQQGYGLWLRDTTFESHFLECDYGSHPQTTGSYGVAKVTRTLSPGRYYVVVKGNNGGSYKLNVRRPQSLPPVVDCDRNSGGASHSVIERDLPAGEYSVIIRGYTNNSTGSYNLIVRDMSAAPAPLSCVYDPNGSTPNTLSVGSLPARDSNNVPIDYYLVMRGNTSTGSYSVRMEMGGTFAPTQCAYNNTTMYESAYVPTNYSTRLYNAEFTDTLPVGEYYVVVKGYDTTGTSTSSKSAQDYGMYQLTVGDQTNYEGASSFAAETWLGAADDGQTGIRKALQDRQIRVITVDSTTGSGDDATYSDQQLRTVAQATDAVAQNGSPLFFKIRSDGTGLGSTIVEAVNNLAGNLAMDVSVRLTESADLPAGKRFRFRVRAVDMPGDSCSAPIDADNDPEHLPDTHVDCRPGAVPRFEVTFENPASNPVPSNPNDPNGGYHMRLDLIGDNQYVVDSIPVYIIPEDVVAEVGDTRFAPMGTYEQVVSATGCMGNEAPLWRDLSWDASLPSGTRIVWNVCTADTVEGLASCVPQLAGSVVSGNACSSDANCPGGYCNASGMCEYVAGASCTTNADCGRSGFCNSETHACNWSDNPIDVKPALARSLQGKKHARVQVILYANATRTRAPTVQNWGLKYTCTAQE